MILVLGVAQIHLGTKMETPGLMKGKSKDEPYSIINWKELQKRYFEVHPTKGFFKRLDAFPAKDLLIDIENERYYLSEIISLNMEKDYKIIEKELFGGKKINSAVGFVGNHFIGILITSRLKSEILINLKLPYQ